MAPGSRQFPPRAIGYEVEWLLPRKSEAIHFLVVRPNRGGEWRGGRQQLFGPFSWDGLPTELVLD